MNRYVLRKEDFGGLIFDREKIRYTAVDNANFQALLVKNEGNLDIITNSFPVGAVISAPTRVFLVLTKACNLKCSYCSNDSGNGKNEKLDFDEVKALLEEMKGMGIFEISVNGGEPLCHPDFARIMRLVKDLGFALFMNTNGVYTKKQLEELSQLDIDKIKVSIDGLKEKHDFLRGKGSFDSAISSIRFLRSKGKNVKMNCTLQRFNLPDMLDLSKLAHELGCELKVAPMYPVGRAIDSASKPLPMEEVEALDKMIQEYWVSRGLKSNTNVALSLFAEVANDMTHYDGKHINCCVHYLHLSIDSDGSVFNTGCQTHFSKEKSFGNVKKEKLRAILEKISADNTSKKMLSQECVDCNIRSKVLNYLDITNEHHGELWESERRKIHF